MIVSKNVVFIVIPKRNEHFEKDFKGRMAVFSEKRSANRYLANALNGRGEIVSKTVRTR